jgi:hypothetical protein
MSEQFSLHDEPGWRISDREFNDMVEKAKVRSLLMLSDVGRVALFEAEQVKGRGKDETKDSLQN